ncbi:helix-turn-helix transcriptional regulator [Ammoniphilus resinae]|uniref:Transcriptional regulator with XRE-family HTH domain n=1 Tax=Ammoniphilus resinae TaxID=861532 RepID=A0ABS4GUU8_9BACL|nr:helix-turn-helix transcriptional regulator [Ammoniphilus resinae]MBP1934035.1 transcriptional regulator with XRE-family HTH domain [Ammoniphilus resinae]
MSSPLGNELKRLREAKGYTLEEASQQIGITRQYLSMLEKGQRKSASFEIMTRLSQIYQVPMEYLGKFIGSNAQELTENELNTWTQLNKKLEEEIYGNSVNELLTWLKAR